MPAGEVRLAVQAARSDAVEGPLPAQPLRQRLVADHDPARRMDHEPGRSPTPPAGAGRAAPSASADAARRPRPIEIRVRGRSPDSDSGPKTPADDVRARLAQVVRQAGDGRRVEQRDDGDVVADLLLEPVDQHGPLDGVAAQLEEVVVDADLLQPQHLAPEARQEFLQGRARGDVGPGRRGPLGRAARAGPGGPPCRRGCGAGPAA